MAGNKKIPITFGIGGPVIGEGTIDENGFFMGELDVTQEERTKMFGDVQGISVWTSSPLKDAEDVEVIAMKGKPDGN